MLKVMTLNLNYFVAKHGPWPARRELVRAVIEDARPDVIALQAVSADPAVDGGADQAHQLAQLLPAYEHAFFQPAATLKDGSAQGSAFLARVPLAETGCLPLSLRPGLEDTNHRVLLHARLDLPDDGPFYLFNAHFSWVYAQASDNLAEALPLINSVAGPALLVGDMNTVPGSDLWQPLKDAGWVDAWQALHPDQDGFTYESDRPYMRIDYAWANATLAPRLASIAILSRERDGSRLSDHAGLLVGA